MRRNRRVVALGLAVAVAVVVAGVWYHGSKTGTFWDDARDGECITDVTYAALRQMQTGSYPRTPIVDCSDPGVNYVIVAHSTDIQIRCPDGDKDVSLSARVKMVSDDGRRTRVSYGFGRMCGAPILHPGRCYAPGNDRGMAVRPKDCDPMSWQVTRRIDGVSDIRRCSPATGLILTEPMVTYCETTAPWPPDLRGNPLVKYLSPEPPPAG